ncbi:MAG: hypothetical protein H7141_04950 [Burkholderiales bacterium]|nr:hypothetical protein [Bacteroidia bacterium]
MTYSFEFDTTIPFKIKDWGSSKDLRNVPNIEQNVKAYYANFREKFAANDSIYFANVMYNKELEMAKALYMTGKAESEKRWQDLLFAVNDKKKYELNSGNFKYIKISDLSLEFYGDGKVVGLINKSKAVLNARGVTYIGKDKTDEGKEYDDLYIFPLYLHIPEGSTELEIIR